MTHILVSRKQELCEVKRSDFRAAPTAQRRGFLCMRPKDGGPEVQADLVQCCHCQRIFVYQRGSGNVRGFCMGCSGITCGCRACDVCVPWQQLIANLGAGLSYEEARAHKPITASVPCDVPTR